MEAILIEMLFQSSQKLKEVTIFRFDLLNMERAPSFSFLFIIKIGISLSCNQLKKVFSEILGPSERPFFKIIIIIIIIINEVYFTFSLHGWVERPVLPDLNLQLPSLLWRTNFSMPEY